MQPLSPVSKCHGPLPRRHGEEDWEQPLATEGAGMIYIIKYICKGVFTYIVERKTLQNRFQYSMN